MLGIDRSRIRVYNAEVGGGFGSKTGFVSEEFVAAWLSVTYGRPVKWIETRRENVQAQTHGRGQVNYIEAAFQHDGRLLGLKVRTIADLSAFLTSMTAMVPNSNPLSRIYIRSWYSDTLTVCKGRIKDQRSTVYSPLDFSLQYPSSRFA